MFITAIIMLSMMSFHAWIVASIIAGGTVSNHSSKNLEIFEKSEIF